ncbi:MAG: hypothetical protein IJJ41_07110 [Clostridia bacterium]|nr:hypothetical protein [Clostridia bacterium]
MNKKKKVIIICVIVGIVVAAVIVLFVIRRPPKAPSPDSTAPTAVTSTDPSAKTGTTVTQKTAPSKGKDTALDFFKTFTEYPAHFVAHGVKPGDEMSSEYYYHATLEIAANGTLKGTYFNNLDSAAGKAVEQKSSWSGKIRGNKVYRTQEGGYYIYLEKVVYEKKPSSSEQKGGKTIEYVCGFGLNQKADNKILLYPPETAIDSITPENSEINMRDFLQMMRKDAQGDTLGCYLLCGENNSFYVSISDEEAQRGEQAEGDSQKQPPQKPQPPQRPQR